jgi:hypothetical protein
LATRRRAVRAGAPTTPQVVVVTVDPAAEPPYYVPARS